MLRGIAGVVVLVLACVGSPAQADATYGTVTGVNGVLYDDCLHQPYHFTVDVPDDAGYRALTTALIGPNGAQVDTDYVPLDANESSGSSDFTLCRPTNPYGTYTIRAWVEWGPEDVPTGEPVRLDDSSFTMRKPRTRTTLSVSTHRPAYGQGVRYRIRALDERPTGYAGTSAAWVFLQKRVDGHWVRMKGGRAMTHATGYVSVRLHYRKHHQRMRVRAVTEPTSRYARSVSPVVRLW
jgi:hypothetical protein